MDNNKKTQAIEGLQNVLNLLKERAKNLEVMTKAHETLHVVDDKLTVARSSLRSLVNTYKELHIDLDGEIYRIYKKVSTQNDVIIEPFLIDCKNCHGK